MRTTCSALTCAALVAFFGDSASADSTNMIELRADEEIALDTGEYVDLSQGGAIEFWYRHQSDRTALKDFSRRKFVDEAYSVVLSAGAHDDLAFAVVVGPRTSGAASLAVLSDLTALADNERLQTSLVRFESRDDLKKTDPTELVNGSHYHFLLAQRAGTDAVNVFLNGTLRGTLRARFGKTSGRTLSLGWKTDPAAAAAENAAAQPVLYPFRGFLGGLRIWRTGDFDERGAERLARFGRSIDRAELTALPEYGDLAACGDFVGERWNPDRRALTSDPARPRLLFADPLAGSWYARGAVVEESRSNASVYDDYAVYTFVPATGAALPTRIGERRYHVFEDANWIGELHPTSIGSSEKWEFRHADEGWRPLVVEHERTNGAWFLRWHLAGMPSGKRLGGASSGAAVLVRRTITEMGVPFLSEIRWSPGELRELQAEAESMSLKFLYTAYPKFFNSLYRGYNIVSMDPWNFFVHGTKTTEPVLLVPTADKFKFDLSSQMILPYDLDVLHSRLSKDSSTSSLVSSAREYNSALTTRLGAGFSGSATIGTGSSFPISASATVNVNLVVQATTVRELSGQSSTSTEKLLRNRWKKEYALHHRKDVTRLSDEYTAALRTLWEEVSVANAVEKRRLVYAFLDRWGTHYPFGAAFGNLEFTETTVDEQMRSTALTDSLAFEISLNEGRSGQERLRKDGNQESVRVGNTISRYVGDDNGMTLIALDLRPLHELLTPQQFPNEPSIYIELRTLLAHGLQAYRAERITGVLDGLDAASRQNMERVLEDLRSPPPATEIKLDVLAVRYKGVSLTSYLPEPLSLVFEKVGTVLDGQIEFWPRLVPERFLPASFKPERDRLQRSLDARGKVVIVDRRTPRQRQRSLLANDQVQAFGEPLATSFELKIPKNERLRDLLHVEVVASFWSETDKPFVRNDETLRLPRSQPFVLNESKPLDLHGSTSSAEFAIATDVCLAKWGRDEGIEWAGRGGSCLWATSSPVSLSPIPSEIDALNAWAKPGKAKFVHGERLSFTKSARDEKGELFVFEQGDWKAASAPVVIGARATGGGGDSVPMFEARVHYEYALLEDFKDVLLRDHRRLLKDADAWGTFEPGASHEEWNAFANRSTANLRFPPSRPVAGTLVDRAGVRADAPISQHTLGPIVFDKGRYAGRDFLVSRGGGAIACWMWAWSRGIDTAEAEAEWTFVEREPGEWWIACTEDGRVLAADGASLRARAAAPGDEEQLWIPSEEKIGGETAYRFRNKWSGTFLAADFTRSSGFDAALLVVPEQAASSVELSESKLRSVTFWIRPAPNLRPRSQLAAASSSEQSLAAAALSAAIATLRKPLPEYGHASFQADLWSELAAAFDADGNDVLDSQETTAADFERFIRSFIPTERFSANESGTRREDFTVWSARNFQAMEKATSAAQVAHHVENALPYVRQWRTRSVIGRIVAAFDADANAALDGAESRGLLAQLAKIPAIGALEVEQIDGAQGAKDGKLSAGEVQSAIAAALRRGPAPRVGASPAAAVAALKTAVGTFLGNEPRYDEATLSQLFTKELTAALDDDRNGAVEPAEVPGGGPLEDFVARNVRRFAQLKSELDSLQLAGTFQEEVRNLRRLGIQRAIAQAVATLDADKNGGLDAREGGVLLASFASFQSLGELEFAGIDALSGEADGKLEPLEIEEAVVSALNLEVYSRPVALAARPSAPERAAPEPSARGVGDDELAAIAERLAIIAQRLRQSDPSAEAVARGLSEILERMYGQLDADADSLLDAAESRGLLAALATAFKGEDGTLELAEADVGEGPEKTGAGDGKLSAAELARALAGSGQ